MVELQGFYCPVMSRLFHFPFIKNKKLLVYDVLDLRTSEGIVGFLPRFKIVTHFWVSILSNLPLSTRVAYQNSWGVPELAGLLVWPVESRFSCWNFTQLAPCQWGSHPDSHPNKLIVNYSMIILRRSLGPLASFRKILDRSAEKRRQKRRTVSQTLLLLLYDDD